MTQAEIPKRNKKIVQLAKENYTADQISEIMGIKRYRVLQILRAFNVKAYKVPHDLQCKKAKSIIKELEAGVMQSDIARKLKVSRQYVSQIKYRYQALNKADNK